MTDMLDMKWKKERGARQTHFSMSYLHTSTD